MSVVHKHNHYHKHNQNRNRTHNSNNRGNNNSNINWNLIRVKSFPTKLQKLCVWQNRCTHQSKKQICMYGRCIWYGTLVPECSPSFASIFRGSRSTTFLKTLSAHTALWASTTAFTCVSVSDGVSEITGGGGSTGCFLAGMMQSFCGMYRKPKCCDCNGCHICTIVHQAVIHSLQRFNKFTSPKTHNSQTLELIIKASSWTDRKQLEGPNKTEATWADTIATWGL